MTYLQRYALDRSEKLVRSLGAQYKIGCPSNLHGCDLYQLRSPSGIQNCHTLLVELFRGNKFAPRTRLLSHSAIWKHGKRLAHQLRWNVVMKQHRTYYCTINQLGISSRDCYLMHEQPSINRENRLNRTILHVHFRRHKNSFVQKTLSTRRKWRCWSQWSHMNPGGRQHFNKPLQ